MSSVTRFLRQIPTGQQYAQVPSTSAIYEFVPGAGNYVGNYPPGTMIPASAALQAALAQNQAFANGVVSTAVRDMGKTIFAPFTSPTGQTGSAYFRQYQLVVARPINATQGFMGGPAGNTFGVVGAPATPDAYTNYMTFYVASIVEGVAPGGFSGATQSTGGQM